MTLFQMPIGIKTSNGAPIGGWMPVSAQTSTLPWTALVLSLAGGILVAATIGLWAYFGSTVFFEMVRNGLAACF